MSEQCPVCKSEIQAMSVPTGSLNDSCQSVLALEVCEYFVGPVQVMGDPILLSDRLDENERSDLIHSLHQFWDLAWGMGRLDAVKQAELTVP